jgi:type IV pilus assembly protein PilE
MAVALPGYQDSMRKGRRADAKAGLMDAANRQERFMLDRNTYTADMVDLGFGADPMVSEEGHYSIDVETPDPNCPIATCYTLTATPVAGGAQAGDAKCTSFTVKSTGAKTATGSAASECW